jgi:hypothetical protein
MTCLLRTNSSSFPKRPCIALWFLALSGLAGIAAYYWMFTGFSVWDDEGTLLLTVRQFLGGMKLYDQIKGYGPVYYSYNWIRIASGTPATHDTVRMSSLIPWLLTALVCAWIVYAQKGHRIVSAGCVRILRENSTKPPHHEK